MAAPSPARRRTDWPSLALALLMLALAVSVAVEAKSKSKVKVCSRNFDCINGTYCCNGTSIYDFFQPYQFENLFSKRNAPVAHAVHFYDYQSFIAAAAMYEPVGFCTTGGVQMQMQELAAFLGMVGCKTSCGYGVATGGPLAYGLCYNHEMSPSQSYCQEDDYVYPCAPGAEYYGRGALPVYWNFNYGRLGKLMNVDLLNYPNLLEQNATLAFQAAIVEWMTPKKKGQPSAHDCFVGNFKPTKNDTLEKRVQGFGCSMNVLYGDALCGQGFIDDMNSCISHYQYYLDLMGVGRQYSGENLNCAEQKAFNPSAPTQTS